MQRRQSVQQVLYAAHLLPAGRSLRGSRIHFFLLHRGLENLLVLRGTGHFITERAEQGRAEEEGGGGASVRTEEETTVKRRSWLVETVTQSAERC